MKEQIEKDKIYNCDCLEGMKHIPNASIDLVVTSPPYNYNLRIHYGEYGGRSVNDHNKYGKMFSDDLPMEEYFKWQCQCIDEMLRVSKGLVFYNIQMITGNKVALCKILGHYATKVKEVIIWDKKNAEPAIHEGVLNSQYEYIIVFDKADAIARQFKTFNAEKGTVTNIWQIGKNTERNIENHGAMFPLTLPRKIIHLFTNEGDTVLDPFMGSGTTAVACIKEKRHFIGFELNKDYYDKACRRIDAERRQLSLF